MYGSFSQNTSTTNLSLGLQVMNIEEKYLLQKYFNNEGSYTTVTVAQQQFYKAPPNYSKLETITITIGSLKWTPKEILSRSEWDQLNVFPYYSDIPNNYYIFPGGDRGAQIGIWPIPSSADNTITFNYKYRVPDLSVADYTTPGSVSVTTLTTAITGSGTSFSKTTNSQLESRWIQFSPTAVSTTAGDNLWYQIASVDSTTGVTLYQPYQGTTITASSSYTIGQMPILQEDFQDMLVWKALTYYFSSVVDNAGKRNEFEDAYNKKLKLLDEYLGNKSVNVNLGRPQPSLNPNLYGQTFGS